MADDIREMLRGGDRRSIGRVPQALKRLDADPRLVGQLVAALGDADPVVCMRAADALEKASLPDASALQKHKRALLRLAGSTAQQEVRWHLAQMIPRLHLWPAERRAVARTLQRYLTDQSSIVRTFALQALADLAQVDSALRPLALRSLRQAVRTGTPAMRSRAARLLHQLSLGARPRARKENRS
ncbi:MAG: hypothetical protein NTY23_10595 [Chloroflexi bacterium]|nr:hypothetical protein [Chloroflexota bacterium]